MVENFKTKNFNLSQAYDMMDQICGNLQNAREEKEILSTSPSVDKETLKQKTKDIKKLTQELIKLHEKIIKLSKTRLKLEEKYNQSITDIYPRLSVDINKKLNKLLKT